MKEKMYNEQLAQHKQLLEDASYFTDNLGAKVTTSGKVEPTLNTEDLWGEMSNEALAR